MGERGDGEARYRAFLSYSHKDQAAAGRLHRRLEAYRLPRRLVGTETPRGPVPERLWPIFRDREELPAATDLSETVREALAQSGALIILCSPHAAGSLWVAEEIETFRRLHPDRPILAAILDGDPPDCFPEKLRAFGQDGTWHEPLATDLRPHRDGMRLGLLKLVAGVTGVGLDALVQRDAQRKIRRVMAVTAAALIALLFTAALALFALDARREAERQRAEAEGQIEFMLTDLREKLRGVGRLDIMTAVNERALRYYAAQELADLSVDSLERRARLLHSMGEDHSDRGNLAAALGAFREAHRITSEQLGRSPSAAERVFAHSQSEYWLGYASYQRRDFTSARRAWERYKALAQRLVTMDPRNADWLKEAAYAEGNLCTVSLEERGGTAAALRSCRDALHRMEIAARASGDISRYRSDLANRHAYVADALKAAGYLREALAHQNRRLAYLDRQLEEDPANARLRARRLWALRAMAKLEADLGEFPRAASMMSDVAQGINELRRLDPENAEWRQAESEILVEKRTLESRLREESP